MNDYLFLSAGFNRYQLGLARNGQWLCCQEQDGNLSDDLHKALKPCLELCKFENLSVFLLNGPGSTLGIRALCAFLRTCLALGKLQLGQIFTCDQLHFTQSYLLQKQPDSKPIICARVNLTTTLCLDGERAIHEASGEEKTNAVWLPHPCLPKNYPLFEFVLQDCLPLLSLTALWKQGILPEVFAL